MRNKKNKISTYIISISLVMILFLISIFSRILMQNSIEIYLLALVVGLAISIALLLLLLIKRAHKVILSIYLLSILSWVFIPNIDFLSFLLGIIMAFLIPAIISFASILKKSKSKQ